MIEIIPSILTQDKETFENNLNAAIPLLPMVQIDIADGILVPNTTWSYKNQKEIVPLLPKEYAVELHLMVQNPSAVIQEWKDVPQVQRVLIHGESGNLQPVFSEIPEHWEIGVVQNPDTPLSDLSTYLNFVDCVMFMGVTPGKQGQPFQPQVLSKIKTFHLEHPAIPIALDGAVNTKTLQSILEAGVTRVCPGSALFGGGEVEDNLEDLRNIIEKT